MMTTTTITTERWNVEVGTGGVSQEQRAALRRRARVKTPPKLHFAQPLNWMVGRIEVKEWPQAGRRPGRMPRVPAPRGELVETPRGELQLVSAAHVRGAQEARSVSLGTVCPIGEEGATQERGSAETKGRVVSLDRLET